MSYLRTVLTLAVLLTVAIVAWRLSSPMAGLLDAYKVKVTLTSQHSPSRPTSPRIVYRMVPPKLYCPN